MNKTETDDETTRWIENEELFRQEMQKGHKYERFLAKKLHRMGFDLQLSDQTFRDDVSEIDQYQDEQDLIVNGYLCEVKSRDLDFTKPSNFPYETIFVDTVSGYEQKKRKPDAILCISQQTHSTIMLSRSTKDQWSISKRNDRVRGITDRFYEAPRSLWEPFDFFVNRLLEET